MKNENAIELFEKLHPDMHFLEQANIYQAIIKSGYNQRELGLKLNKAQASIANKLRLLNLSQACRSMIIANNLTERHARALLIVKDDKLRQEILAYVIENKLTVWNTEKLIKEGKVTEKSGDSQKMFIMAMNQAIKNLKKNGVNAKAGRSMRDGYTDYVIRIYKWQEARS